MTSTHPKVSIGIVGPCASGKSTLIAGLQRKGIYARHIAQEHSYVPDMWKKMVNPDLLIYLDASYSTTLQRRKSDWSEAEYNEQVTRLYHARRWADFYLNTDDMSIEEVCIQVFNFINSKVE